MKLNYLEEPLLEFGRGQHICPKAGITNFDVYDVKLKARREKIFVGAVGTSDNLAQLRTWLTRCSKHISPPESNQPNLFPGFCGFNPSVGFKASLVIEDEITRTLTSSSLKKVLEIENWDQKIDEAVELYYRHVKFLAQNRVVDVVVCILPNDLYDAIRTRESAPLEETLEENSKDNLETDFRRALKAKVMHLGVPIQLARELTLESDAKTQQDDATKAWNFCTALYYKANQTVPWKLVTNINRPSVCFVGIGFYRSRDRKSLHTSLAQIFDELGNSVILRGTPIEKNKDDPVPHLSAEQAFDLLSRALSEYEVALDTAPARVVIHKSSTYNAAELDGFKEAADSLRVHRTDFVTILDANIRLLRNGIYPPYRGTHIELDKQTHLLYTRGSVEYFRTYPGLYIPQPLEVRIVDSDESPSVICQEILGLTKMNWNNTQFDRKYPITLECARKVGQIMKYLPENEKPQISYSFYM